MPSSALFQHTFFTSSSDDDRCRARSRMRIGVPLTKSGTPVNHTYVYMSFVMGQSDDCF
jgi:hypothetical protein